MNRRNHSFVMESKLHDVKGRVDYISSPKRQENLYAVFSNVEDSYWNLLAEQNLRDFAKKRNRRNLHRSQRVDYYVTAESDTL